MEQMPWKKVNNSLLKFWYWWSGYQDKPILAEAEAEPIISRQFRTHGGWLRLSDGQLVSAKKESIQALVKAGLLVEGESPFKMGLVRIDVAREGKKRYLMLRHPQAIVATRAKSHPALKQIAHMNGEPQIGTAI